jgi:hypothetical protein
VVRRGWFGHSAEHSLAARGVRIYAKRKSSDPMFYAVKREREIPSSHIFDMVRKGATYHQMCVQYPGRGEEVRKKGLVALESVDADGTLSTLERQRIDESVLRSQMSPAFRERALWVLQNPQRRSFLHPEKAAALQERMRAVRPQ